MGLGTAFRAFFVALGGSDRSIAIDFGYFRAAGANI